MKKGDIFNLGREYQPMVVKKSYRLKKEDKKDKDEDFDCKKAIKSIKVKGLKTLKKLKMF